MLQNQNCVPRSDRCGLQRVAPPETRYGDAGCPIVRYRDGFTPPSGSGSPLPNAQRSLRWRRLALAIGLAVVCAAAVFGTLTFYAFAARGLLEDFADRREAKGDRNEDGSSGALLA